MQTDRVFPGQVVRYAEPLHGEAERRFVILQADTDCVTMRLLSPERWGFARAMAPVEVVAPGDVCHAT